MSHIVQIQTEVRDPAAIQAACGRLKWPEPVFGETKLFTSSTVGWAVRLPEWRYPVDEQAGEELAPDWSHFAEDESAEVVS